jgi:hypothetical protein
MYRVKQWAIKEPSIKAYKASSMSIGPKKDLVEELEKGIKKVERW